jgi:dTMP kinase
VEEAMQAAEKHEARSEKLAALVAEARELLEQARAAEAERVRAAAEAAAAAAAVEAAAQAAEAAERQQLVTELAALDRRTQQAQAQLGVPPAAPAPHLDAEETLCVLCYDAPKDHSVANLKISVCPSVDPIWERRAPPRRCAPLLLAPPPPRMRSSSPSRGSSSPVNVTT